MISIDERAEMLKRELYKKWIEEEEDLPKETSSFLCTNEQEQRN